MLTIHKYPFPLDIDNTADIDMPEGATVLCIQAQREAPFMWAQVDTSRPMRSRRFGIYGTGCPMPENPGRYVGTFQLHGGMLVFHVYERPAQ